MVGAPQTPLFGGPPQVLSVTQVNARARALLERSFADLQVMGEISNARADANGHRWFCLKDRGAVLSAVMFRRDAMAAALPPRDGMLVTASGRLTIYPQNGRYQMVVSRLAAHGAGALQAAFDALKAKLQAEGLFAAARKRRLPLMPRCVAAVTSPTGAVIRDIVQVAGRRFPNFRLLLFPARVQGPDSAESLVQALAEVARLRAAYAIDVLVLARGGGSLEDLWGFNDERLARALAAFPLPTVSAVGHETDFTIADFVADVRAPTPSAAAELVFPKKSELGLQLTELQGRLARAQQRGLRDRRLGLRALRAELGDGRGVLRLQAQRLASLDAALERSLRQRLAQHRTRLGAAALAVERLHPRVRLMGVKARLHGAREQLRRQAARLPEAGRRRLQAAELRLRAPARPLLWRRRQRLAAAAQRLQALSPLGVLGRGYGIVLDAAGRAVRGPDEVGAGDRLQIRVARGTLWARAEAPGRGEDAAGDR